MAKYLKEETRTPEKRIGEAKASLTYQCRPIGLEVSKADAVPQNLELGAPSRAKEYREQMWSPRKPESEDPDCPAKEEEQDARSREGENRKRWERRRNEEDE